MSSAKVRQKSKSRAFKLGVAFLAIVFVVMLGPGLLNIGTGRALADGDRDDHDRGDNRWHHRADACAQTSWAALNACKSAAQEEYYLALGRCKNVSKEEQGDCKAEAKDDFGSALEECKEQFDARQEVCAEVGPGPYLPEGINPSDFKIAPSLTTGYFPLKPGTKYTYKNYDENGKIQETIVVQVKNEIREIEGVNCRVVQDTAYEGDDVVDKIEDTTDWYALDNSGTVWYFGEIAQNFEDGVLDNIDGSWTAGKEGAKPGIIMFANPADHIGETYRQEFALSEAEDMGKIIEIIDALPALPDGVTLPAGVHGPYLHTQDFSALEPDVVEDKYYAPGVGNILVVNEDTGEIEVLVTIE